MMKRILILILTLCLLSGCGAYEVTPPPEDTEATEATTAETTPTPTATEEEDTRIPPVYSEWEIDKPVYDLTVFNALYECEKGSLVNCSVDNAVGGYSGEGYVKGLMNPDSKLVVTANIPSNQHYSVIVCGYSETPATGTLYVDGLPRGKFTVGGAGEYECVMFDNIYLEEGEVQITFASLTADIAFDYVALQNCTTSYTKAYTFTAQLSNPKASEAASKLYRYICECFGDEVLTSAQVTQGTNDEIQEIFYTTGRYPAIRFSDMMDYGVGLDSGDVEIALEWAEQGGIVGYDWYWVKNGSCYSVKSDFDITKCINDHDVARLNEKRLKELYESGGVTDETISLLEDIDRVAEQLTKLKEADVAVLFRPLPEASSGEFWWGDSLEGYKWLYELIYARLCDYHHLDNLIWIWNGQSADWYVGDDLCDIIGLDIYDFSGALWDNQSHINQLINVTNMCNHKPIAITECNVLPSPSLLSIDHAFWSFATTWSGSTLDKEGQLSTKYMSEDEWVLFYNCSLTQTRDELGRIK